MTATHEPSASDAGELIRTIANLWPQQRVDHVYAALMDAFRRGQAFERRESESLAHDAATAFAEDMRDMAANHTGTDLELAEKAQWLAAVHAGDFASTMAARRAQDVARDKLPWPLREDLTSAV